MKNPWTAFFDWYKGWIKDLVSTNHIIVTGVALSVIYVVWALAADSLGRPLKESTLDALGFFLTTMIAGGVAQFGLKRFSDDKVIAAKTGATMPPRATTTVPRMEG